MWLPKKTPYFLVLPTIPISYDLPIYHHSKKNPYQFKENVSRSAKSRNNINFKPWQITNFFAFDWEHCDILEFSISDQIFISNTIGKTIKCWSLAGSLLFFLVFFCLNFLIIFSLFSNFDSQAARWGCPRQGRFPATGRTWCPPRTSRRASRTGGTPSSTSTTTRIGR